MGSKQFPHKTIECEGNVPDNQSFAPIVDDKIRPIFRPQFLVTVYVIEFNILLLANLSIISGEMLKFVVTRVDNNLLLIHTVFTSTNTICNTFSYSFNIVWGKFFSIVTHHYRAHLSTNSSCIIIILPKFYYYNSNIPCLSKIFKY